MFEYSEMFTKILTTGHDLCHANIEDCTKTYLGGGVMITIIVGHHWSL